MFIEEKIYMNALQRNRVVTIYVPDDYQTSQKRYPVLYINDGQNAFFDEESYLKISWGFYDYVKEQGLDVIMVAIPCNYHTNKREDEYGPWLIGKDVLMMEYGDDNLEIGGEGDQYLQFIINQLKPYIDQRFPTIVEDSAMVGSSMGGIITTYAGLKYPNIFKKTASLSSAYWFYLDEFVDLIHHCDLQATECFYLDLGGNEGNGDEEMNRIYYESNEIVYNELVKVCHKVEARFFEMASHNEYEWRQRVPIFMDLFYK